MWIKRKSAVSGIERTMNIPVNPDDYLAWENGLGNIQDLMPYLTDDHREFILTGITADEWDALWSEDEDEFVEDEL